MKIFSINDCDWYAGDSLESVMECARNFTGSTDDELFGEPYELTLEDLARIVFVDDDNSKRSFGDELTRRIAGGDIFPCFFASTEG